MADVASTLAAWSTTAASNLPTGATPISSNLDDNLRQIQAVVRTLASANTIASATTTDLSTINETFVTVSGTTPITGLGTVSAGIYKWLTFSGILTFTHNATSLILPGGANITTAANDTCLVKSLGSGNWQALLYVRGTGAVVGADFSSNTSTSVDGEIVLFSGTGGKTGKRATTTGILKGTSGVLSAASAGTDYADVAFKTISVSGQNDVVADSAADTLTLAAGSGITITTDASTDTVTITSSVTAPNVFQTIAVSGQSNVVADQASDTLTLAAGSNITLTTNASTDTVTIAASISVGDHGVVVHTGNGHGSTNTKIRRFTTTLTNVGTAITYADSATNGASFTINEAGLYEVYYCDRSSVAGVFAGVTVNSSELTTDVYSTLISTRALMYKLDTSSSAHPGTRTLKLGAGDVVRAHTQGAGVMQDSNDQVVFAIRKIGTP